jgi:hypothetical protein
LPLSNVYGTRYKYSRRKILTQALAGISKHLWPEKTVNASVLAHLWRIEENRSVVQSQEKKLADGYPLPSTQDVKQHNPNAGFHIDELFQE